MSGFEGDFAIFEGGSREAFDCVIFTNGYQPDFPFIESPKGAERRHPGTLYLNMFNPELGDKLAFCGFARPAIGSIPPTAETSGQVFFAALLPVKEFLPDKVQMLRHMKNDAGTKRKHFPALSQPNVVISWIPYMDELADLIGLPAKSMAPVGASPIIVESSDRPHDRRHISFAR